VLVLVLVLEWVLASPWKSALYRGEEKKKEKVPLVVFPFELARVGVTEFGPTPREQDHCNAAQMENHRRRQAFPQVGRVPDDGGACDFLA
jgi:hypothetical protein